MPAVERLVGHEHSAPSGLVQLLNEANPTALDRKAIVVRVDFGLTLTLQRVERCILLACLGNVLAKKLLERLAEQLPREDVVVFELLLRLQGVAAVLLHPQGHLVWSQIVDGRAPQLDRYDALRV